MSGERLGVIAASQFCKRVEGRGESSGKSVVFGNVAGADAGNRGQADAVIGRRGLQIILVDRDEEGLWSIDCEDVAGTRAGVVNIAHAKAAAGGCLRARSIGKANSRGKVAEIGVDERLAFDAAVVLQKIYNPPAP